MQPGEQVRIALFLGVVVLVCVLAAGILFRLILHRFGLTTLSKARAQV